MHRGTTSIYRRVTMAASSGTKKICLIAVTGKPGTAYLPKKLLVCSSQDVFTAYVPFCLAPTDSSLEGNAAPLLVPGHRFLWCILHLQSAFVKGFLQKSQNYFSQAFVSQQHNAHLFKNFPTYHPLVRKGRNKSKSPIGPCPFFGFIADLFHKSLGEIADIGGV